MTHHPDLEEFLSFPYISLIQCATSVSQSVLTPHCLLSVQSLYRLTIFVHILCLPTMHSLLPAIHLSLFRFTTLTFSSSNLEEEWQATPVFLPGKSHGQRTLVGYSPRGHKRVGYHLKAKQQQSSMYTLPPFLLAKPPLLIPCTLGCKLCESMMHLSLFFFFLY